MLRTNMKKVLLFVTIDRVVRQRGGNNMVKAVDKALRENYSCELADCSENPQYLISVLKGSFENFWDEVAISTKNEFADFVYEETMLKYLSSLQKEGYRVRSNARKNPNTHRRAT